MPDLLRFVLTVLSMAMAYAAQGLLGGGLAGTQAGGWSPQLQSTIACGLYIGAAGLFAWVALPEGEPLAGPRAPSGRAARRRLHDPDARIVRHGRPPGAGRKQGGWQHLVPLLRLLMVWAAVGLSIAACALFLLRGEDATVRWIWLGSLVVLLLSQLPLSFRRRQQSSDRRWVGDLFLLLVVAAAAILLRTYLLQSIPSDFHGDSASHGLEARKLLTGDQTGIFSTMFYQIPTMAFVPAALSMAAFGNDLLGLRMASVIGGTLTVVGLYLVARELFRDRSGRRVAILAAAVLAVSYVHNHFSRIPEYMDPWPFALFSLYFLLRGLQLRERLSMVAGGVLMAFCLQMYYSGRVLPLIFAAFLLYIYIWHRDLLRGNIGGLTLFVLAALLGLGPMIPFYIGRPFDLIARSRAVFLFSPPVMEHLLTKYGASTLAEVVREQAKLSLLMFHSSTDSSTQFGLGRPMLDPLTSPLLVLGVGYALRRLRRRGHALAIFWLLSVMVVGSMLTNNAPFWPRLVGILPAAALLIALAAERVWALAEEVWGETASALAALLLAVALVYVGLFGWQVYSEATKDNARPRARIGRYLYGLDPVVNACLLVEPFQLEVREIAFLAHPRGTYDLPADAHGSELDGCPGPQRVYILTPNHQDVLAELETRYPGGVWEEHFDEEDNLIFVSYLLQ